MVAITSLRWLKNYSTYGHVETLASAIAEGARSVADVDVAKQPAFYREWMDSFFARDIQRLIGFRDTAPRRLASAGRPWKAICVRWKSPTPSR